MSTFSGMETVGYTLFLSFFPETEQCFFGRRCAFQENINRVWSTTLSRCGPRALLERRSLKSRLTPLEIAAVDRNHYDCVRAAVIPLSSDDETPPASGPRPKLYDMTSFHHNELTTMGTDIVTGTEAITLTSRGCPDYSCIGCRRSEYCQRSFWHRHHLRQDSLPGGNDLAQR